MKKTVLLIIPLLFLFVSCEDEQGESAGNNLIDLEFVVIKSNSSGQPGNLEDNNVISDCLSESPGDCAGNCGGNAVEQTYYYDNDGDDLGGDYSKIFCSALVPDNWVLNSDDDDDTIASCLIFNTLTLLEENLEITNGYLSFTYNEEGYSIDVSSCIDIDSNYALRILQDVELKLLYLFEDNGFGYVYSYSSPNEILFVK